MANHRRDPRKKQLWRGHLDAQKLSGLSVREFCRRHRLAEASFYHWHFRGGKLAMTANTSTSELALPDDAVKLKAVPHEVLQTNREQGRQLEQLQARLDLLLRRLYGRQAERVDPDQMLLFAGDVHPGERRRPEKLGEDAKADITRAVGMFAKDALERLGERGSEDGRGLIQSGMRGVEDGDAGGQQVEAIAPRTEGVPAEFAVPVEMEVGAVVLLEGDAAFEWDAGAGADFWLVEHGDEPSG